MFDKEKYAEYLGMCLESCALELGMDNFDLNSVTIDDFIDKVNEVYHPASKYVKNKPNLDERPTQEILLRKFIISKIINNFYFYRLYSQ